jgi:hypothetical protein
LRVSFFEPASLLHYDCICNILTVAYNSLRNHKHMPIFAVLPPFNSGQLPTANDGFNYLAMIANKGIYWLATFAFLIAAIMIIVAGIKFMIAGGDDEKR